MNYVCEWIKKVLYIAGAIYVVIVLVGKCVILNK